MNYVLFVGILCATFFGFSQQNQVPKLVVSIVVDQMCYDYLYRFEKKFSKSGFIKLMRQGTNCTNTRYTYVPTYTGPGHASIYTGTTPSNHGIVANEWFDSTCGKIINCVEDSTVSTVGSSSNEGKCSPRKLKTTTLTDQLKMTYSASKVISLSLKDRGAILPGGHLSDGSYWFDDETGNFITSTFFRKELPEWVNTFNQEQRAQKALSSVWNTLYDSRTYTESGPDNSPYEQLLPGKDTPTFPYDFTVMRKQAKTKQGYSLFTYSPFANTALTDLAISAVKSEKLGNDEWTDILCLSYSTPDIVGHAFGPYSVEIEDLYLRLDLDLSRLLSFLENEIDKNEFLVVLTADHAVVPVPQQLTDRKMPGGYFYSNPLFASLREKVKTTFGIDPIKEYINCNIYLDHVMIAEKNINRDEITQYIVNEVRRWESVKAAYTGRELIGNNQGDEWFRMLQRGYHANESGDVLFLLESGYLPKSEDKPKAHLGTSHGSAFNYDTHVPLIWYGTGIQSSAISRKVEITDIAATLSNFLKLQRTGSMTGEPISEMFK
jgi:predicted AlkP superfamily pyrophosphatase or phosphodiesterase